MAIDLYVIMFWTDEMNSNQIPWSLYYVTALVRPLVIGVFDLVCALVIYLSATNRFPFFSVSQAEQVERLMSQTAEQLSNAAAKLHAANAIRDAVVRDAALKERDDEYYRRFMDDDDGIWEEEEVAQALSRVVEGRDLKKVNVNADEYVRRVTAALQEGS